MPATFTDREAVPVVAQLPAHLLHVAALFASDDPTKGSINQVHVVAAGDYLRVESTNGHFAFRCTLPTGNTDNAVGGYWLTVLDLLIDAAAWRKRPAAGAEVALIRADGEARVYGKRTKRDQVSLLEARLGGPIEGVHGYTFPNLPQVWPQTFDCSGAQPIAWNASYMATINDVCARYSDTGTIRFEWNTATAPVQLVCGSPWPDAEMQFLLMPVQLINR